MRHHQVDVKDLAEVAAGARLTLDVAGGELDAHELQAEAFAVRLAEHFERGQLDLLADQRGLSSMVAQMRHVSDKQVGDALPLRVRVDRAEPARRGDQRRQLVFEAVVRLEADADVGGDEPPTPMRNDGHCAVVHYVASQPRRIGRVLDLIAERVDLDMRSRCVVVARFFVISSLQMVVPST